MQRCKTNLIHNSSRPDYTSLIYQLQANLIHNSKFTVYSLLLSDTDFRICPNHFYYINAIFLFKFLESFTYINQDTLIADNIQYKNYNSICQRVTPRMRESLVQVVTVPPAKIRIRSTPRDHFRVQRFAKASH